MPSLKISQLTQVANDTETLGSELAGYLSGVNYKIPVSDFANSCVLENMTGNLDLSTRASGVLPIANGGTNTTTSSDVLLSLFSSAPNSTFAANNSGTVALRPDRRFLYIPFMKASFDNYYNNAFTVSTGTWTTYTARTQDSPPGSMASTKTYVDPQLLFPVETTYMTQAHFSITLEAVGFSSLDFRVVTKQASGALENTLVPATTVSFGGGIQELTSITSLSWPSSFSTTPSLEFEINPAANGAIIIYEVDMFILSRPL